MEVSATRYLDPTVLSRLGIRQDIEMMIENISWGNFVGQAESVYNTLVLELFSLAVIKVPKFGHDHIPGVVRFRLGGQPHTLSARDLADNFGWPEVGERYFGGHSWNTLCFLEAYCADHLQYRAEQGIGDA